MLKIFDLGTHFSEHEPTLSIIDVRNTSKGLEKKASTDPDIQSFVSELSPSAGKTFVHILAMSAAEYYGQNRNSDSFPESNLIRSHNTFVSLPGLIFRNHKNRDKTKAIGQIIHSVYNPRMHRVEVIAELWNDKCQDVVTRIEMGDWPATSMSCRLPHDTCSICGNQAKTRTEYCTHLRNELGKIYPDGRRVSAINDAPLSLFEVSVVGRPADPISSILQKVASITEDGEVVGSAELAELEGMQDLEKGAAFKKLSEMIKEIQGDPVACSKNLETLLDRIKDPSPDVTAKVLKFPLKDSLVALADAGISPSVGFLAEMIARHEFGEDEGAGLGAFAAQVLMEQGIDGIEKKASLDLDYQFGLGGLVGGMAGSPYIGQALAPAMMGSSMYPQYVQQRIIDNASTGRGFRPQGNIGYIGNGPAVANSPVVVQPGIKDEAILVKLIKLGAKALAAKWIISNLIDRKMREAQLSHDSSTKIVLVKSAKECNSVLELAKGAMLRDLNRYINR